MKKIDGLQVYNSGYIGNNDPEEYTVEPLLLSSYPETTQEDKTKQIKSKSNNHQEVEPMLPILYNF